MPRPVCRPVAWGRGSPEVTRGRGGVGAVTCEAEWAGIKQEVAGGRVLTLAHADAAADGGGTPDATGGDAGMASDIAAWKAAAKGVGTLADNLSKAGTKLYEAQQGMDTSLQFSDCTFETLTAHAQLHPT